MYCKPVGDPCDPLSVPRPITKYAATQFWVATHGLRTQALNLHLYNLEVSKFGLTIMSF